MAWCALVACIAPVVNGIHSECITLQNTFPRQRASVFCVTRSSQHPKYVNLRAIADFAYLIQGDVCYFGAVPLWNAGNIDVFLWRSCIKPQIHQQNIVHDEFHACEHIFCAEI